MLKNVSIADVSTSIGRESETVGFRSIVYILEARSVTLNGFRVNRSTAKEYSVEIATSQHVAVTNSEFNHNSLLNATIVNVADVTLVEFYNTTFHNNTI